MQTHHSRACVPNYLSWDNISVLSSIRSRYLHPEPNAIIQPKLFKQPILSLLTTSHLFLLAETTIKSLAHIFSLFTFDSWLTLVLPHVDFVVWYAPSSRDLWIQQLSFQWKSFPDLLALPYQIIIIKLTFYDRYLLPSKQYMLFNHINFHYPTLSLSAFYLLE